MDKIGAMDGKHGQARSDHTPPNGFICQPYSPNPVLSFIHIVSLSIANPTQLGCLGDTSAGTEEVFKNRSHNAVTPH